MKACPLSLGKNRKAFDIKGSGQKNAQKLLTNIDTSAKISVPLVEGSFFVPSFRNLQGVRSVTREALKVRINR